MRHFRQLYDYMAYPVLHLNATIAKPGNELQA
eukprot:SAG11_NODE_36552_length_261_cov_0.617284_1_plen_31_part_01